MTTRQTRAEREAALVRPPCAECGKPAACFGSYEDGPWSYACDECCGHGCEDGNCVQLDDHAELARVMNAIVKQSVANDEAADAMQLQLNEVAIERDESDTCRRLVEQERDAAIARAELSSAQLSMVASELAGDSKLHWQDRSDPRWSPALQEAWTAAQKRREDAAQIVDLMHGRDAAIARAEAAEAALAAVRERRRLCGGDSGSHWCKAQEERDAAIARAERAEHAPVCDKHGSYTLPLDVFGECPLCSAVANMCMASRERDEALRELANARRDLDYVRGSRGTIIEMYNATARDLASARAELAAMREKRDEAERYLLNLYQACEKAAPHLLGPTDVAITEAIRERARP